MKSLAEFLNETSVDQPAAPASEPARVSVKTFCREILATPEYRASLLVRIVDGTLPAAVECMLWDRAAGKVTEKLQVTDNRRQLVADMSTDDIRARLLELADVAAQLATQTPDTPDPDPTVH